jgi:hypothetical protein
MCHAKGKNKKLGDSGSLSKSAVTVDSFSISKSGSSIAHSLSPIKTSTQGGDGTLLRSSSAGAGQEDTKHLSRKALTAAFAKSQALLVPMDVNGLKGVRSASHMDSTSSEPGRKNLPPLSHSYSAPGVGAEDIYAAANKSLGHALLSNTLPDKLKKSPFYSSSSSKELVRTSKMPSEKVLRSLSQAVGGHSAVRAEHDVSKKMSGSIWSRPELKTGNERGLHPRSKLVSVELQGPTSWSSDDLRRKYRGETEREAAWEGQQDIVEQMALLEAAGQPPGAVPSLDRHPMHRAVEATVEIENVRICNRARARNRMKVFVLSVSQVWDSRRRAGDDGFAAESLANSHSTHGLPRRADIEGIKMGSSQLQSVSVERALEGRLVPHAEARAVNEHLAEQRGEGTVSELREYGFHDMARSSEVTVETILKDAPITISSVGGDGSLAQEVSEEGRFVLTVTARRVVQKPWYYSKHVYSPVECSLFGNQEIDFSAVQQKDESDFSHSFLSLAQEQFCISIYDKKTGVMNYSFVDSGTEDGAAGNAKGAKLIYNDADGGVAENPAEDSSHQKDRCSVWLISPEEGAEPTVSDLKFHVVLTPSGEDDVQEEMYVVDADALALAAGLDMAWRSFLRDRIMSDERVGNDRLESILESGRNNPPHLTEYYQEGVLRLHHERREIMTQWWVERECTDPDSWRRLKSCLRLFSARAAADRDMADDDDGAIASASSSPPVAEVDKTKKQQQQAAAIRFSFADAEVQHVMESRLKNVQNVMAGASVSKLQLKDEAAAGSDLNVLSHLNRFNFALPGKGTSEVPMMVDVRGGVESVCPSSTLRAPCTLLGQWQREEWETEDSLSMMVCGRSEFQGAVPGTCHVGKRGLWWSYPPPSRNLWLGKQREGAVGSGRAGNVPEEKREEEYTQPVAVFVRDPTLSSTKSILVTLCMALDTPTLVPLQTVWFNGGEAPPLESESIVATMGGEYKEHGSFSFPGILNLPPQLTALSAMLGSEPVISLVDPLVPPTCLILNKCEDPLDWEGDDLFVEPMKKLSSPERGRSAAAPPTVRGALHTTNPGQHTAHKTGGDLHLQSGGVGEEVTGRRPPQHRRVWQEKDPHRFRNKFEVKLLVPDPRIHAHIFGITQVRRILCCLYRQRFQPHTKHTHTHTP